MIEKKSQTRVKEDEECAGVAGQEPGKETYLESGMEVAERLNAQGDDVERVLMDSSSDLNSDSVSEPKDL